MKALLSLRLPGSFALALAHSTFSFGCRAQFYLQRNFQVGIVTVTGPAEADSMAKGTARALRREIDSVSIDPKATLQIYEYAMCKNQVVGFPENSREGGLIRKLSCASRGESCGAAPLQRVRAQMPAAPSNSRQARIEDNGNPCDTLSSSRCP